MNTAIGHDLERVDGRLKVTGAARYTADFAVPALAHAALVTSAIANGRVLAIDGAAAAAAPGFLALLTHAHLPPLPGSADFKANAGQVGEKRLPLADERIHYGGQIVAVVVAESWEQAVYAASLVAVRYAQDKPATAMSQGRSRPVSETVDQEMKVRRGDLAAGLEAAEVRVDAVYSTPMEHHNPMEPSGAIAVWDADDHLTLYEPTQNVMGLRAVMAERLGLAPAHIHVVSPFVGGGFGCKGSVWHHPWLAALAARAVGRPVKLILRRADTFANTGHRSPTRQAITLGATRAGRLTAVRHAVTVHTSPVDEFVEPSGWVTRVIYACPNLDVDHEIVALNVGTPTPMRAPGEATGTFALECAMDELAQALAMDPIALRLANHADVNPHSGLPWSSKHLRACYERGAAHFGWDRRDPRPRALREDGELVGYGMATAIFPAYRLGASAQAAIGDDGQVVVRSATHDLGTGTYTILTQIAAEALGVPAQRVRVELGDSRFPHAPVSGGSMTAASVGPAVQAACLALRRRLVAMALDDPESPLQGLSEAELVAADGQLRAARDPGRRDDYAALLRRRGVARVEAAGEARPGDEQSRYAFESFGAQFAEVRVDEALGRVRVTRLLGVFDVGRILNPQTARSQLIGGMTFGLGMALMEESRFDPASGLFITNNLADYRIPVHADIPAIEVDFIGEPDLHFNPLGARGIGEIGITGVAAAIANAVFHATGRRIRDLPLTAEKLLATAPDA